MIFNLAYCLRVIPFLYKRNLISLTKMSFAENWIDLDVDNCNELRPDKTLIMGQCFNWRHITSSNNLIDDSKLSVVYVGVLDNTPLAIKYENNKTFFKYLPHNNTNKIDTKSIPIEQVKHKLYNYFQLKFSLSHLYNVWSSGCPRMKVIIPHLQGVRVVKQDPWECLISFICSSNNNIKRITLMLDRLRYTYGSYLCTITPSHSICNDQKADLNTDLIQITDDWTVHIDSSLNDNKHIVKDTSEVMSLLQSPSKQSKPSSKKRKASSPTSTTTNTPTDTLTNTDHDANDTSLLDTSFTSYTTDDSTLPSSPLITPFHLFSFPTIDTLASAEEEALKALGMGYRAKFIINTAKKVQAYGGQQWLEYLEELGRLDMVFSDVDSNNNNSHSNTSEGKGRIPTTPSPSSSPAAIINSSLRIKQEYKHQTIPSSIPHQNSITATDSNTAIANPSSTGTGTSDVLVQARPVEAKLYSGVPGDGGSRAYIQSQLMLLPGVGPKVCCMYISACICMYSTHDICLFTRVYRWLTASLSSR